MTSTTLCYIEKDGCYLMLHRVKKQHDLNKGKWIGVGGHIEPGESAEECIRRETREETGLILGNVRLRGVVEFISKRWENEHMYLYTSDDFSGELTGGTDAAADSGSKILKSSGQVQSVTDGLYAGNRQGQSVTDGLYAGNRQGQSVTDGLYAGNWQGQSVTTGSYSDSGQVKSGAQPGEGEIASAEGILKWVPKPDVFDLNLWEGDRVFLDYLLEDAPFFHLELDYDEHDELIRTVLLPNLILASGSPRRRELLEQVDLMPVVLPSEVEEHMEGATPEDLVKNLARQKAEEVAERFADIFTNGEVILGADTVVAVDGEILGKPHSHEEAAEMIRSIAGREHQVYTGVTLIRCGEGGDESAQDGDAEDQNKTRRREETFAECTDVYVSPMTEEEIIGYAETDEPMDKAGAYGIQGKFAAFIEKIDGDYTTVVGLPLGAVCRHLKQYL